MAVSGLEMAQNSARLSWSKEEVDDKLKSIMKSIFNASKEVRFTDLFWSAPVGLHCDTKPAGPGPAAQGQTPSSNLALASLNCSKGRQKQSIYV